MLLVNKELIEMATYDVWPTDDWFPLIFHFRQDKFVPLNEKYNDFKFETQNFIMIMGSLYIQFAILIFKFLIFGLLSISCIRDYKYVAKVRIFLTDGLFWNEVFEFLFGAYTEILFALVIHSNKVNWAHKSNFAPNVSWLFFLIIALGLPFWLFYFLKKNESRLSEDSFQEKYSQGYVGVGGIKLQNCPYAIFRPIFYLVRRLILVSILYYGRDISVVLAIDLLLMN
jgi:hypothetical protein